MEKADNRIYNSVGSSRIRGRNVYKYWKEAEEYRIGGTYDVIIFQKVYWRDMLESFNGIKILDLCDPDWLEGKPVMEFINMCDACTTSTEALAEYIRNFVNVPVLCIPDRIDPEAYREKRTEHIGRIRNAVWFGYANNAHYINRTIPFLSRNNIKLTVISNDIYRQPPGLPKIEIENIHYVQDKLYKEMVKADVCLLPDPSTVNERGKFKSNNKDLDAYMLGLPVVKDPDDIEKYMDPEVRRRDSIDNFAATRENCHVKKSVEDYKKLIEGIQNE